mmetsp:Transcript_13959/g.20909  ORF Transcript_13959/g.20909 Transcript_13959/m.20909 type:complete len:438 (-) Transcript_13959:1771-3084(-)
MASKTTITTAVEATSSSPPMTRAIVVDVRDRYRPKQEGDKDIRNWLKDPQNVYCGRPNIYKKSGCIWGNPFKVGRDGTLEEVIEKFREFLLSEALVFINASGSKKTKNVSSSLSLSTTMPTPLLLKIPSKLCGKNLGCWCVGEHACHAQTLAFVANLCAEMNIQNEDDMRRVLEEECENKNETATALEKERTTKGFIQRLKEVDLLYLDAEYKDKRSARNKKKKVAMRNGGTESKGVKKEKFNPQNGGEDRNDIDGGKHHDRYNSTSIFVSNLAYKTSVEDLKNHMCATGNVNQASVLTNEDGRSKGCGIVQYQEPQEAARAIRELQKSILCGRPIFVRGYHNKQGGGGDHGSGRNNGCQLFIRNLSFDTTWRELKDHFQPCGDIDRVEILKAPNGRKKGFGTVCFYRQKDAQNAIHYLNGVELKGRRLEVHVDQKS